MTEYERWLADEKVPLGKQPFHRGYSMLGIDHGAMYKRFQETGTVELPPPQEFRPCRDMGIARFSFAIPNGEALAAIAAGGPVLECGAGTGYWAWELRKLGCDVIASDPDPYSTEPGTRLGSGGVAAKPHDWGGVLKMNARVAALHHGEGRNLLLVWPSLDRRWPANVLAQRDWPVVFYVGEGSGGCTADDRFHDLLDELYEEREVIVIPQWEGIHDVLHVMDRKK